MEEKMIGGISLTKWKEVFRELCETAMDKDYFSDILFYDLYPNTGAEAAAVDEDNEEHNPYSEKWDHAYEALKEIFGERD